MSDIVERLRDQRYCGQEQLRHEAADEIERLRAKVARLSATATRALPYVENAPYEGSLTAYEQLYQAIADEDVECVMGWCVPEEWGWGVYHKRPELADAAWSTVIIHKEEKPYGA